MCCESHVRVSYFQIKMYIKTYKYRSTINRVQNFKKLLAALLYATFIHLTTWNVLSDIAQIRFLLL